MTIHSCPRTSRGHGGLAIIQKPGINLKINNKTNKYDTFEYMEATLKTKEGLLRFFNVYHAPYSVGNRYTKLHFLKEFEEFLEIIPSKTGTPIFIGDFNFHMEEVNEHYTIQLNELLDRASLYQHVPTNISTHRAGGTLDLLITPESFNSKVSNINVYDHGTDSDHYLVTFLVDDMVSINNSEKELSYRKFNDIDIFAFNKDLENSDINKPHLWTSLDEAVNIYNETLIQLMDKHCPIKRKTVGKVNNKSPWFDKELIKLRRKRRAAERRWCKNRKPSDKEEYKRLRDAVNKMMKIKRLCYHRKTLMDAKDNPKKLYQRINNLLGKPTNELPEHSNSSDLAEEFKTFFSDKVHNIKESIETVHNIYEHTEPVEQTTSMLTGFKLLTSDDLLMLIKGMSKKFCSIDPVPTWIVIECYEQLKSILTFIVNKSLETGTFPQTLKAAMIRPTIKKHDQDKDTLTNYRPISNLSFLSKVLERAALNQISPYLDYNKLHCPVQSGYRPNHSCETLTIKMFDDIIDNMEQRKVVALVLLDLSAAFDTVDHEILLRKLQNDFGICGKVLSWITSYLTDRSFAVNINNSNSSSGFLLFGVPQGSILGPVLFILYTKDILRIAQKHGLELQLYADDSQLYIGFKPTVPEDRWGVVKKISECITEIKAWMCKNFMKLNEDKTKLMLIGTPHVINSCRRFWVKVNDTCITCCTEDDEIMSLGVQLDQNLSLKKQIGRVCKKAYGQIMNLGRIRAVLSENLKIMLVKTLVISQLDYSNAIYYNLPDYLIKKLERVLNAALRFIYGIKRREDITPYYIKAHILPIRFRVEYKICLLTHKAVHGEAPEYIKSLIHLRHPLKSMICVPTNEYIPRSTEDDVLLQRPKLGNSALSERRFSHQAPAIWNTLPYNIRRCKNTEIFKKELKTLFFNKIQN